MKPFGKKLPFTQKAFKFLLWKNLAKPLNKTGLRPNQAESAAPKQRCLPKAQSRHVISAMRQQPKQSPRIFYSGACMELLAGLVRSAATEQRLFANGAIASRYFGNTGSSQSKAPEFFIRGLAWSYWPDLNRRPADYESAALPTEPQ